MQPVERPIAWFRRLDAQWKAGELDLDTALAQIDALGAEVLEHLRLARAAADAPGAKSATSRQRLSAEAAMVAQDAGAFLFRSRRGGDDDRARQSEATWEAVGQKLEWYVWANHRRDMTGAFRAVVEARILLRSAITADDS
jgi:hypothetical protein